MDFCCFIEENGIRGVVDYAKKNGEVAGLV